MIIPKDPKKLGIILEIKSTDKTNPEGQKDIANEAMLQINEKKYDAVLQQDAIQNCLKIGIAFNGKELAVTSQKEHLNY